MDSIYKELAKCFIKDGGNEPVKTVKQKLIAIGFTGAEAHVATNAKSADELKKAGFNVERIRIILNVKKQFNTKDSSEKDKEWNAIVSKYKQLKEDGYAKYERGAESREEFEKIKRKLRTMSKSYGYIDVTKDSKTKDNYYEGLNTEQKSLLKAEEARMRNKSMTREQVVAMYNTGWKTYSDDRSLSIADMKKIIAHNNVKRKLRSLDDKNDG